MTERGREDPRRGRAAAGAAALGQTPDFQNGGRPDNLGNSPPRSNEGQHGGPARLEVPALRSATRGWRPGPTLPVPGGGTAENADRHQPHPTARLGPTWAKRKTGGMLGQQPERGHGHDGRGKAAQTIGQHGQRWPSWLQEKARRRWSLDTYQLHRLHYENEALKGKNASTRTLTDTAIINEMNTRARGGNPADIPHHDIGFSLPHSHSLSISPSLICSPFCLSPFVSCSTSFCV